MEFYIKSLFSLETEGDTEIFFSDLICQDKLFYIVF